MWRITIFAAFLLLTIQLGLTKEIPLKADASSKPDTGPSLIMFDSEQLLGEHKPESVQMIPEKLETTVKPTSPEPTTTQSLPPVHIEENGINPSIAPKEPRRQITFDQRQDGQYNIRADLDNFMIVVIPPNPSAGVDLLDLLTRSSDKRTNSKKSNKKSYIDGGKLNRPFGMVKNNLNYLSRGPFQLSQPAPERFTDYIEGRTPYRVDISSNAGDSNVAAHDAQLLPSDGQIDVIPPPFPSNYQQLMKPYHLEVEPEIMHHQSSPSLQSQTSGFTLPLSQGFLSSSPGNLMEFFNRASGGRFSKSIKTQADRNSIRMLYSNGLSSAGTADAYNYLEKYNKRDIDYYPYYMGITNDAIYPPLSSDSINFNDYNKEIGADLDDELLDNNENNGSNAGETSAQQWDLKLIGATEQCGPDRVRDSYGVCQFIKNI